MKLIEGEVTKNVAGFVIFGNGRRDKCIVRAFAKKFNGRKSLLIPTIPFQTQGVENSLRAIVWIVDNISRYFFSGKLKIILVIDREHINDFEKSLSNYFIYEKIKETTHLLKYRIERLGGKIAILYVAIMGKEKKIEENIATLIEEILKVCIRPEKNVISRFLRQKNEKIESIIMKATINQLRKASVT